MGRAEDGLAEPVVRLGPDLGNVLGVDSRGGVGGARLDLDEAHFVVVKWLCCTTPSQLLHIDNVVEKLLRFLHGPEVHSCQNWSTAVRAILLVGGAGGDRCRARVTTILGLGQAARRLEQSKTLHALLRWLNHYELLGCVVCCNCVAGLE